MQWTLFLLNKGIVPYLYCKGLQTPLPDFGHPLYSANRYVELKSSRLSGNALKKLSCDSPDCGFCNNILYILFNCAVSMGKYCAAAVERYKFGDKKR